ncbi:OmpA family protein [Flavobacteriaceae bacterium S0862]|nr:OmpA family protein [Flavobacteriaceae bacterium S0862]
MIKKILYIFFLFGNIMFSQTELKHEVYFDTDEYEVSDIEDNRLLLFIRDIQNQDIAKISIYGFCDDIGSDSYNLQLSQQRANAIKSIFSEHEIDNTLISNVDGKGEVLLKTINTVDADVIRGLNRKVEIIAYVYIPPRPEVIKEEETMESALKGDLKVGDKVVLDNILFRTGYSDVLPESMETLEKIAILLNERSDVYFTIQGHVCCTKNTMDAVDRKTKKRNLSEARARYIYYYLSRKGVSKKRMRYEGMRRKYPLGGDPKYDRRVEILVTRIIKNDDK